MLTIYLQSSKHIFNIHCTTYQVCLSCNVENVLLEQFAVFLLNLRISALFAVDLARIFTNAADDANVFSSRRSTDWRKTRRFQGRGWNCRLFDFQIKHGFSSDFGFNYPSFKHILIYPMSVRIWRFLR